MTRHQTEPLWTDVGRMDIFDEDGRTQQAFRSYSKHIVYSP